MKSFFRKHTPTALLPLARAIWSFADSFNIRKNRSYLHGLLFDIRGKPYSTENMEFEFSPDQFPRSYRSRFWFDIYEEPERNLSKKWIRPDSTVLELGGCIGVLSCVVNSLLSSRNQHVVIEANPTLIPILSRNRERNSCAFKIENGLLSKKKNEEFYIDRLMTANRKDSMRGRLVHIPSVSLHELEERYDLKFDTLIMDIEGGELDVLRDNADTLGQFKVVILELHRKILTPEEIRQCVQLLTEAGLRKIDHHEETEVWERSTDK